MKRPLFFLFLLSAAAGCRERDAGKQLARLYGQRFDLEIVLPYLSSEQGPKVIVYHGPNDCSTCELGHISRWDVITSQLSPAVPVLFVIAPGKNQTKQVVQYIRTNKLGRYPITIDSLGLFQRDNPVIPEDRSLHTFLLDRNDCIVLVGNPLGSDAMWNLFRSTLDNMLAHDGLYVPEER